MLQGVKLALGTLFLYDCSTLSSYSVYSLEAPYVLGEARPPGPPRADAHAVSIRVTKIFGQGTSMVKFPLIQFHHHAKFRYYFSYCMLKYAQKRYQKLKKRWGSALFDWERG